MGDEHDGTLTFGLNVPDGLLGGGVGRHQAEVVGVCTATQDVEGERGRRQPVLDISPHFGGVPCPVNQDDGGGFVDRPVAAGPFTTHKKRASARPKDSARPRLAPFMSHDASKSVDLGVDVKAAHYSHGVGRGVEGSQ